MNTLADYAKEKGASLGHSCMADLVIVETEKAKGMFFSGDVVEHISVKTNDMGLNGTGCWPYYLVDKGKELVILRAC